MKKILILAAILLSFVSYSYETDEKIQGIIERCQENQGHQYLENIYQIEFSETFFSKNVQSMMINELNNLQEKGLINYYHVYSLIELTVLDVEKTNVIFSILSPLLEKNLNERYFPLSCVINPNMPSGGAATISN